MFGLSMFIEWKKVVLREIAKSQDAEYKAESHAQIKFHQFADVVADASAYCGFAGVGVDDSSLEESVKFGQSSGARASGASGDAGGFDPTVDVGGGTTSTASDCGSGRVAGHRRSEAERFFRGTTTVTDSAFGFGTS